MNTQNPEILVLGGGYAGMIAALRLAGKSRAHITLVNALDTFVERIRLHQRAADQPLPQHSIPTLLGGKNVSFVQGWVTQLDTDQRAVTVQTTQGAQTLHYDILVYALGSTIDRDSVPGVREHAYALNADNVGDLSKILPNSERLLVIGGGLTGIEAATEFAEAYPQLQVTLATCDTFGENLSRKGQVYLRKSFARLGISIRDNAEVTEVLPNAARLANGETLAFDVCVWAGAFRVGTLADDAGLKVNERGQILIDRQMRSFSHPDIYAVGDAAYCPEVPTRMSCAAAMPMGSHAADNIAAALKGQPQKPFRFGYAGQCISLGRSDAMFQIVNSDDQPQEQIISGRLAVGIKELICRLTVFSLHQPNFYIWPSPQTRIPDGRYIRELSPDAVRNRL